MYEFLGVVALLIVYGFSWWRQAVEAERVKSLADMRAVGVLDQGESRPYLINDGGRGPGGGRILLAAPVTEGLRCYAILCGIIALACSVIGVRILSANAVGEYWLVLVVGIAAFLASFYMVMRLMTVRQFLVEIDPYPAATGGKVTLRIYAQGAYGGRATYHVRLIQRESTRDLHSNAHPWRRAILWSSPLQSRTVMIDPTGLIEEFEWQLPESESGTYREPNYELTWGVQIGCTFRDSLPLIGELYPFPVVQ